MTERLEIIITATDKTSNVFRAIEREARSAFGGIGGSVQNLGNNIAGFGKDLAVWTAPLAVGLGKGIQTFSKFEDVLAEIKARTGATGEEMDAVKQKALDMGAATAFSAVDAGNAILQLLASGYDLDEAFAALPATLNAAAAGALDLGYTADVVTDALAMWNLGAEDADRVANTLAQGAAASSAEINDLAQGLSNVGPMAAEFGLSIEDTVAILAAFSERGIKGAEAGTQLRSMLTNMTRDTEKVTGTWKKLGISMYDAEGQVRPLEEVLSELQSAFVQMTDQERIETIKTLAGSYGQMGLSVLTSSDAMEQMNNLMIGQADAATVAAARMDTLSGRTESLWGSVETLMINGLEPLIENALKPFIEIATVAINKVNDWVLANPELTEQITQLMAGLVVAGPTLFIVGKAIALVGTAIGLLANPLAWAAVAIAGLALAYRENWLGIGDAVDKFVKWFTTNAAPVIRDYILNTLVPAIENLFEEIKEGWETAKPFLELLRVWFVEEALPAIRDWIVDTAIPTIEQFIEIIKDIWEEAKPMLQEFALWFLDSALPDIISFVTGTAIPTVQRFIEILKDIWEEVQPYLIAISDWFVTSALPGIVSFITGTVIPNIQSLINTLQDIWRIAQPMLSLFVNWVTSNFNTLRTTVIDPLKNALNDVIRVINDIINGITDLGNVNINLGPLGTLKFGDGGMFQGFGITGDTGEELVYAPGGAVVFPPEITRMLQGLKGNTYNLTYNSPTTNNVQDDFRMMEAMASG